MTISGSSLFQGYEVMPQDKMEQTKKLTEEVIGGAIKKQTDLQQKMFNVNAQMQVGQNNMIQQQSMISLFV